MAAPPILLLPCRRETHLAGLAGAWEVQVRVFPDDVHVDTHELELTPDERSWGSAFQEAHDQPAAWNQLAERFGEPRAAYLAHATARGARDPGTRASAWTRAPRARLLPKAWTAYFYDTDGQPVRNADGTPLTAKGKDIQPDLAVGPDPKPGVPRSGSPPTDAAMRWMIDFQQAVAVGMGLGIKLTDAQRNQLDAVLVVGWDDRLSPTAAAAKPGEHLESHHFSGGVGRVRPPTPPNHTA